MTMVSLTAPVLWPGLTAYWTGSPSFNTIATLSASGHYVAYAMVAREDMTISHIGFRCGTVANSPTAEVRIETVDGTTGLPSGTLWATNTNATSATLTTNSNPLTALTASATITKGQLFCVKIQWGGVATSTLIVQSFDAPNPSGSLPYRIVNTGTPTKAVQTTCGTIALGSSSTTFYHVPGLYPLATNGNGNFNNTNSAKRGLKFTVPFKCRAVGIRWYNSNTTGDFNAVIYDNQGTPVEFGSTSTAFDGDNTSGSANACCSVYFDTAATLVAGTTYRAVIEPTSATNANVATMTLPTSDYYSAFPGGTAVTYTSFATATWTDSTTQLPALDILIDQVDDGTGSGGGVGVIGG